MQVLFGIGRDRHAVEVVRVDDCRRVVQVVDHVVNRTAVRCSLMRGTYENELFVTSHLWAGLRGANAEELHDQEVQLKDELADVLILPDALVYVLRQLADFDDIGRLIPDQLLEVLLNGKRPFHL